jgi:hypothetical protein
VLEWNGQPFLRVSFQAYNSHDDSAALVKALAACLPKA